MVSIPVQFDDLLEVVKQLPIEQKRILIEELEKDAAQHNLSTESQKHERTPGLHAGMIWVSDDFDDPLPDEFWLGEDA